MKFGICFTHLHLNLILQCTNNNNNNNNNNNYFLLLLLLLHMFINNKLYGGWFITLDIS